MSKIYGLFGSMTGKLADTVMVVRNGVQIARKYQPVVSNPSTKAQVEARAKLKLMSQLSAVVGPVVAMPRLGLVSARNRFTKKNYPLISFSDSQASLNISGMQLTDSVVSMSRITASRSENALNAHILGADSPAAGSISRVVYVALTRAADGTLRLWDSAVSNVPGGSSTFNVEMAATNAEVYVYAYGIRDNSEAAIAKFGSMNVASATQIASLLVSRVLTEADVTVTETVSVHLDVPTQNNSSRDGEDSEKDEVVTSKVSKK